MAECGRSGESQGGRGWIACQSARNPPRLPVRRAALVSEEELFVAPGALADGTFAAGFSGGNATARTFAREGLRDGNHSRSAPYPDRIRTVTREQVRAAAQKYLHPERMNIVVIGPIDEIRAAPPIEDERQLEEYGRSAPAR